MKAQTYSFKNWSRNFQQLLKVYRRHGDLYIICRNSLKKSI